MADIPEALRLADVLDWWVNETGTAPMERDEAMTLAASELRRLHESCEFMLAATREAQALCSMYIERMQKAEAEVARMTEKVDQLQSWLRNIEGACVYSPYRELNQWDAGLAGAIHAAAKYLPPEGAAIERDRNG